MEVVCVGSTSILESKRAWCVLYGFFLEGGEGCNSNYGEFVVNIITTCTQVL